ncbi:MAG TPA: hotdog domain-containing protein [Thermoanaerobaculia bacterium]|nr:hotdog domain-containing protein [Thermoanaerobaculia bacterium]
MRTSTETRPRTHRQLDPAWCGRVTRLGEDDAEVELATTEAMRADEHGLVHGGFVFGLADHAAMVAVDEPTVVLAAAEVRFAAPVRVGDRLVAAARVEWREGRRRRVAVAVRRGEETVLSGSFECYVPERHVLAPREG